MHDRTQASIWLIDFAKTVSLPGGANITHMNEWIVGNHEDGYLIGINNLIRIFEEILAGDDDEPQSNEQSNEEANICEYNENDDATSNPAVCTCEHTQESTEVHMETNMNLPQEIDAMKIDQTMQQSNRERADDAKWSSEFGAIVMLSYQNIVKLWILKWTGILCFDCKFIPVDIFVMKWKMEKLKRYML